MGAPLSRRNFIGGAGRIIGASAARRIVGKRAVTKFPSPISHRRGVRQPVTLPWRVIYKDYGVDAPNKTTLPDFLDARLEPLNATAVDLVVFDPYSSELMPIFPIDDPAK